ncbi:Phage-related lysozyme (muramidase), GH24 family [Pseudomonas flavescens]|uniref:Lysozyme n=1 Tax=Phytopseudomonas flavescens TaxID=29435 RepID=A0A1G8NVI7_9GAMM|nr:lysozyme [Pseudomonas flavescens]SDI83966.1 Phage-related lysozyme (muramidase), GH24 family [Pseudomonas flavescens]
MSLRGRITVGTLLLASAPLMAFLGTWEGDGQNTVKPDNLARGLPTVCKGITKHTSPYPVIVGDYWSDERCEEVERLVVSKGQLELADCITNTAITQSTFDALSSHGHNVGNPSTCASRAAVLINMGRVTEGCNALAWGADGRPVWAYVTDAQGRKVFVRGLHNRRLAEVRLCKEGL